MSQLQSVAEKFLLFVRCYRNKLYVQGYAVYLVCRLMDLNVELKHHLSEITFC